MGNNSSAYETYRKLMGASAGAGSGTSAHGETKQSQQKAGGGQAYRLYQAYTRRENKAQNQRREATINGWANRYNQLQSKAKNGLNDDFLTEVSALIKDYNAPTGVHQNIGKLNQQQFSDAYQSLLSLQNAGKEWKAQQQLQAARAQTASGLLPEDANEVARHRQMNIAKAQSLQKQIDEAEEEMRSKFDRRNPDSEEYEQAQSRYHTLQDEYDKLAGQIRDMDSMLTIYNRVDRFQADNVDALKGKAGFDTARKDYGAKAGERAEKARSLQEEIKEIEQQLQSDWRNPENSSDYEELSKRYYELQDEYDRLSGTDELGEYLDWFEGQKNVPLSYKNEQIARGGMAYVAGVSEGHKRHWERMTEDEINTYYYLVNNEGAEAANKYLDGLQLTLDRRYTLAQEEFIENEMKETSLIGNMLRGVATVPENLVGGPVAFVGNAIDKARGKAMNPYSDANLPSNLSSKTRSVAAQKVYEYVAGDGDSKGMNVLGEVASNAYQAGLSTLDSLAGIATLGGGSIVTMGMGAASSRMRELFESGASDKEIYVGAIGSGILEALFEKVSLDTFADQWLRANPEKFIRKMLVQAGVEASEEVFTEISNQILDAANRGVNSDHERRVRQLMNDPENPLSEAEARQKAACEDAMEVFWAGFGGFLSGSMSSVGGAIADGTRQQQVGQDIISRKGQGDVLSEALELRPNDKTAQNLQAKNEAGNLTGKNGRAKATDARRLGGLAERNAADMTGKDAAAVTLAIRNRAEEIGSPGDSQALAEAIWKQMTGEQLSLSDRYTLRMNRQITEQIESEIFSAFTGEEGSNDWVKKVGTYNLAPEAFGVRELNSQKSARENMEQMASDIFGRQSKAVLAVYRQGQSRGNYLEEATKVFHAGQQRTDIDSIAGLSTLTQTQKAMLYQIGRDSSAGDSYEFDNGAQGQSYLKSDHSPVNISGFSEIKEGSAVLLTDEGNRVAAEDVQFGDYGAARLYRTVAGMGLDTDGANELLQAAKESGLSDAAFAVAVQEAYLNGRRGISLDSMSRDSAAIQLKEDIRQAAWEAGQAAAQRENTQRQEKINKGQHGKKEGKLTIERSARVIAKNMNAQQKSALDMAKLFSSMGMNVTVYASSKAQRKTGMENGYIHLSDGRIRVDINSGMEGQGVMAWALSHEFTHFVEEMSPEKFRTFTDVLFAEAAKNGIDTQELIEFKARELRSQEANKNLSEEKLQKLAYSEAVAEMMETVLTDTDAIGRISQKLKQEDESLWGKIKKYLEGLVDRLKEVYKNFAPDSLIAKITRQTVSTSEAILNAYVDAAADAVMNYNLQEGQKNIAPEGVRTSPRVGTAEDGRSIYEGSFPKGTPKLAKSKVILKYIQNVWSKKPISLKITDTDGSKKTILAQFDPTYDPEIRGDASKIAGGNRHGNAVEQRVTLDLGPDYYDILSESTFNYSKPEIGKDAEAHRGVKTWHYFVDEIYFAEKGLQDFQPFTVSINVKEKANGNFVYSFSAEKGEFSTPGTLHAQVSSPVSRVTDAELSGESILQPAAEVKKEFSSRNHQKQLEARETENERLKLEVEYLQKVVQIHKQGNRDYTLDKNSLKNQALDLMRSNNAKGDASELAAIMDELYRYFATDENWQWDVLQEKAGKAADWLIEHQKHNREEYAQSALDWLAKRHVRLNEGQIGEIKYQFGSMSEFKKAIKGTIIIDQEANTELDQLWSEGAEEYGYLFDESVSDADMPRAFVELVQGLKDSKSADQAELEYSRERWKEELIRQVLNKFHQVNPVESISDKMKQQISQLKQEHKEAIAQLKTKQKNALDEVREAGKRALAEYRRQRDITFKAKEAVYIAELEQIKKAHERDMAQLRTQYSEDTKTMQTEFIRLLREYDASGKRNDRLEQRLEEQARKLAGSRENEAVWQREFKRLLREYEASGRSIERLEQTVQIQQARAKVKVEAAERTAMRGRLERTLAMLNRYLLKPSKTLYVPDSLQPAVIKAMQAINGVQLGGVKENAVRMKDALESLSAAYASLMETNEGRFTEEYHEGIMELLDSAKEVIGDTEYRQLSKAQLEAVHDAYTGILTIIRNENRMFAANLKTGYEETARAAYGELRGQESKSRLMSRLMERLEEQSWNNEKPYYAFERLGSGVLMRLYQNLRKGEDVWQQDTSSAEVYAKEIMLQYNYDEWTDGLVELDSSNGETFCLNLEERLSLYALSKRNQALEHLTHGGFILAESTREVKGPFGLRTERIVRDPRAYALTADAVAAIRDGRNLLKLTQEQMNFADAMRDYLSTVCAEKNNEISRALYGVSLAKEKNYWPLKSSGIKSERIRRSQENPVNRQKNAGHMKATVEHANNTVELTGFMQTWATHVENTAMYHAFTLPMEDFFRVYNWNGRDGAMGMRQMLMDKHGAAAVAYIDTFLKDLNGGLRADPRESLQNLLLSSFKKSAVSASLSVAIQQPSAVGRAFSVIMPKFFTGAKIESNGNLDETWETMKRYAPVAGIKEIGRFDVGMGASTTDILTGKADKGLTAKVDKATGFLPEYMDKVTWVAIWEAAKRQTKYANPSLDGEALLTKAGELFTECITKTQVYDSVFSRSGNMRSKSSAMKMLTAFMAEPTTTANMAMSAIRDAKNGNWETAGKKAASLGTALVLNSILASLVYASRDQDEEKTWVEKYLKSLISELVDGVNPLEYVPGIKDIWSIFQGYDVERSDMSLYADLAKYALKFSQAWQDYNEVDEDDQEARKAALKKAGITTTDFAAGVMNLMGLPLRNLLRDVRAIANVLTAKPRQSDRYTKGYAMWQALNNYAPQVFRQKDGKTQELYKAMQSGSQVWIERMKEGYETEDKFNTDVVNALMSEDKRIRQAAKAIYTGNEKEADNIEEEITGEGHFTQKQVEKAISKQLEKLPGVSYEALLEEVRAGADIRETTELLKHCGYTEENIQKKAKDGIQEWYQGGAISKQEAAQKLKAYLGMHQSNIDKTVNKWTSKLVTGIDFGNIKAEFLEGNISKSRAVDMYVLYGGYTRDSAAETVNKWGCEKEFGIPYSDLKEAFLNGDISEQKLIQALIKYGGRSSEEAESTAATYAWRKRNPGYGLSDDQIKAYTKPISALGYSLEKAGVKPDVYLAYRDRAKQCEGEDANGDGKTDSGSKKNQKMEVINALPISREQKDALYYSEGWSAKDIHKAPWH